MLTLETFEFRSLTHLFIKVHLKIHMFLNSYALKLYEARNFGVQILYKSPDPPKMMSITVYLCAYLCRYCQLE